MAGVLMNGKLTYRLFHTMYYVIEYAVLGSMSMCVKWLLDNSLFYRQSNLVERALLFIR